jgi:glycosyltransferase involved in cell wall biosynthesis
MFSVIVPAFNRGLLLAATLDGPLAQQANMAYEIIVLDNNSTDDTKAVVRSCAAAKVRCGT